MLKQWIRNNRSRDQLRSPISYYGGKQAMMHEILPRVPQHDCYTEVFFGGGTLFWGKNPVKNETINDKSELVINFYVTLKREYKALKLKIDETLVSRSQHRCALYMIRNPKKFSCIDLAWAFWMCTNFSFSNKIGGGIKYSNHQTTVVPDQMINKKARFTEALVERIEHAHIECSDAKQVLLSRNIESAFHYIDPPYFNADMGHYAHFKFDEYETMDLFDTIEKLNGKFLLSSYNSEILSSYISKNNWKVAEFPIRLQAPGKKMGKTKIETLVWNYHISEIAGMKSLFELHES